MSAAHTPGPWVVVHRTNAHIEIEAPNQFGYSAKKIAVTSLTNHVANAQLIAAAPDLLEACYSAMKDLMYVSQKFDVALGSFGQLDAAYRKATGEAISKQEG